MNKESGKLRGIIINGAGETHNVLAHQLPDIASTFVSPVVILVFLFLFDWRLGLTSLSLIFFITSFDCAYAAEENGSLNIILTYERQAIDGAEFSVYQVAKWNEKESRHTVKAPFRWNGDFVNIKTADDQLKLSLYFEKQSRNIKEMMKGETGDDGTAKFTDLKDGIYLVVQTGSSGKAKDFTNVQPFLVIIPQFENGIQNRVVNAKPKTEIQRKEKPEIPPQTPPDLSPKKRPQTGDITNMFRWNGVLMLSSGMLLLFFRIRQKSKIGEESVDEKE